MFARGSELLGRTFARSSRDGRRGRRAAGRGRGRSRGARVFARLRATRRAIACLPGLQDPVPATRSSDNTGARIAEIADPISILIQLVRVSHPTAVVGLIRHSVPVQIIRGTLTGIPLAIEVTVLLAGIRDAGAVVSFVCDSVPIHVGIAPIAESVEISV